MCYDVQYTVYTSTSNVATLGNQVADVCSAEYSTEYSTEYSSVVRVRVVRGWEDVQSEI